MLELMNDLNSFAADNRWVFWPVIGAIITTILGIRSIGIRKFRDGNHPVQAILAMLIIGAFVGLFMAWLTKILFH